MENHPANICLGGDVLQKRLKDLLKTYLRPIQDFKNSRRLVKTSSKCFEEHYEGI